MWFGTLGAPLAWLTQFAIGYWLTEAQCHPTGSQWGIPLRTWAIVITVVAASVAVAAGLTAVALFRGTREADKDDPPPSGRTHFLAIVGMAITPLFMCIILMNGVGVAVLEHCHQS
jgi:heme/copper-type cytochrome/quinol oxidase subunit 2